MFQVAATKRSRSRTQRFSSALFRRGSVWFKTEKVFALLNIIALLLPSLVVWPTTAYAVNATIRQEINLIDGYFTAPTGDYATTSAIIQIDTNNYNGASFYFEAVASTTSATPAMLTLKNARTFASSTSMWVRGTASALYRSAVFTPTAGANDYVAVWGNDSTGKSAAAIRIVVIQTAASITDTETQIEIGSEETYTSSATSTFTAPKYWYYDGTKWDGSVNYYAEVTYANTLGSATTTSRFTTAGTSNIIASTTLAIVAAWGGGGAGFDGANTGGGAGGGGGAFASSTLPLTPGSTTPITVGAGGSASAGNGATSTFSNLVSAPGGTGGKSVTTAIGYGGVGTLGVGTTKFSGGNGGQGVGTDDGGGGGGGAGGPHGNGGTGATASATIGGGGGGGDGGNNGTNGTPPNGGSSVNGGAGGDGGNGGNGTNGTSNNNGGGGGGGGDNGTNGGNGGSPGGGGGGGETGTWLGAAGAIELKFRPTASTTIVLQKDDGAFGTWTDVVYIVSADEFRHATSTRKRSAAFTPETGKNYRIAFREGYDGAAHTIYNAKIIVDQTGSPTKYEPQYLLANKTLAGGTALQNYFTSWDPAEWSGVAPIFTHEASSQSGGTSDALIQNTSGPATITGSAITNIGYRATSTTAGMTMPVSAATLDVLADANNGDVYASRILVQVSPLSAPTVTTQSAASMTRTTATLNGTVTVTGGATIVSRGFAWGTDPTLLGGDTATTSENGSFGTGAFTNTSIVFTCGTTYYSRAFAANSQGTSTGAVSASFATSACFTPTTFSGRIYTDEGTTELTTAGKTLMVRFGTSTAGFFATSTIAANGFWQIQSVSNLGFYLGMPISAWIDGDSTFRAFTFTKASSTASNITGLDLYKNYVIVKHEGFTGTSTTIADLGVYDGASNSSIRFSTSSGALNVWATSTLYIAPGTTFAPGGAITLHGNKGGNGDGDLRLATGLRQDGAAASSTLSMAANALTLAGSWMASSSAAFFHTGTVTFNSTSTAQKLIVATSSPFNALTWNGVGGSWSFGANAATTSGAFTITNGTVTAPSTALTIQGNFTQNGSFTDNSGTVSFSSTSAQTITGTMNTAATDFANVKFLGAGTKTFSANASSTNFTINSGATVVAPELLSIAGNYTQNGTSTNGGASVWTSRTSASGNTWAAVTYGNGLFVAVSYSGTGNRVMTSPDGITWTSRTSAADNDWQSVTYGNGLFVAVANTGTGNRVQTSPDGITWTIRTSAADNGWQDVTYGNSLFVAVANTGTGDRVQTSPDGITWTIRTSATDNLWDSVTHGNGLFVAVARSGTGNRVMTSPDGITWTSRTSAADNAWYSVTFGNGLFVAVAGTGTGNRVMTSPDGITWTLRSSAADNGWRGVTYANGLFVAVSLDGSGNRVMTSPDGITWTIRSAVNSSWLGVTYGNGLFVAVAPGAVMTSPDGITYFNSASAQTISGTMTGASAFAGTTFIGSGTKTFSNNASTSNFTINSGASVVAPELLSVAGNYTQNGTFTAIGGNWTTRTSAANNDWRAVTYGNGLFVAVAITGTGNRVMTSPDGITWTIRTSAADNAWGSVTYGNGLFVAVSYTGTGNRVMTSPDGITWTIRTSAADNAWWGVAYGNGLFVAVSDTGTGNRVMTSPDGITWTLRTSAANNNWRAVTFGNGLFVAVSDTGASNNVMTSPDGITWTIRSATDKDWRSVTYGNGLFVAVSIEGTGTRVMTSPDGITWTIRTSAADNNWVSVTYGNGLFVAVALTGTGNGIMASPDGITWTTRTSAADNQWYGVTYANGLFVAVSISGTGNRVMTSGGTVYMNGTTAQTLSGTMTGSSAFGHVNFLAAGTKSFGTNAASTTNFTIDSSSGAVTAPSTLLSIAGNYTQNSTFTHNSGLVYLNGTTQQTLSGTMTGSTNGFNNLTILNNSGTNPDSNPGVIFANSASTTGTFTATVASTTIRFAAGATSSVGNLTLTGTSAVAPIFLRSSVPGTPWFLHVTGTQSVSYVDVQDSYACAGNSIVNTNGTDSLGNSCWSFPVIVNLTLSGRIYTDEGTTQLASAGKTLMVRVGTSTAGFFATSTVAANGFWQIPNILNTGVFIGMPVHAWIDGDSSFKAFTFTKASSTSNSITGLDLYKDYIIVKHEGFTGTSTTIADLGVYDGASNSSIRFSTSSGALNMWATSTLYIAPGTTFAPGGAVTLHGNAGGNGDGDLRLATGLRQDGVASTSILSMGSNNLTLAGNWFASSSALFTETGAGEVSFNSTSSAQKQVIATTSPFNFLKFNGTGGSWTFGSNAATTTNNIGFNAGIVTLPSSNLAIGLTVNKTSGTINHNSGTIILYGSSNQTIAGFIGTNGFNNIEFRGAGTKSFGANAASTTNFTIASDSGIVTAPSTRLTIAGNYNNQAGDGKFAHNNGTVYFGTTTVSALGSLDNIATAGYPALAALNSTDVAFIDETNDDLRTYRWNGTTWTLLGSLDNIATVGFPALAALNSTDVAFIDSTNDDLRTYRWNGTTWTLIGSLDDIATAGWPALTALNSTDVAFIDDSNDDLRTYRWNGTTWTLLGSLDNIAGVGSPAIAALNATDVAFIDSINADLRTYRWNGTTWTLLGSLDNIAFGGLTALTALNSTDVVFIDSGGDDLRTYRWNGTTWTLLGSLDNIAGVGSPALAALNSTDVAFIDYDNDDLRTYRIGGTATGTMTGTSAFNNLTIVGKAAFGTNASTTNLTLSGATSTLTAPPLLTIAGNYTNNGTFSANSGTVYFATSSPATQTLSGTMTGGLMTTIPTAWNAFHNIEFVGAGAKSFGANASTTGSVTINSGAPVTAPALLSIAGNYTNSGTATFGTGLVYLNGTSAQTLSGTMTGTSAFASTTFLGAGTKSFGATAASTTGNFVIDSSSGAVTAPSTYLSIGGNYTNNATAGFTHNSGTTTFSGTIAQTLSGNMIAGNAFAHLEFINSSATTTFMNSASSTNFFASTSNVHLEFAPGATTSVYGNLVLHGTSGSPVNIFSTTNGSPWYIYASSTYAITYTNIQDSDACARELNASTGGTNSDRGGNSCWIFIGEATFAALANQIFTVGDASTAMSELTITDSGTPVFTAANDLRIAIATSTTFMRWDTSITGATFSGTACPDPYAASCKVSTTTLSYEGGGSVLLIPVNTNFAAGDTLIFSALKFMTFATASAPVAGLHVFKDGPTDQTADVSNSKTITIKGLTAGAEHTALQFTNQIDVSGVNLTSLALYAFNLFVAGGESMSVTNLTFNLSGVQGIAAGDITNAKVYIDYDGDKTVDAGDTQVGGAGAVTITGETGTIIFSTTFTATTTRDYILQADVASVGFADGITLTLTPSAVTASGLTSLQTTSPTSTVALSSARHSKVPRGGSEVGSTAPTGASIVTGGGQGAGTPGETIGSDPGFFPPTTTGGSFNEWTTPSSGYLSDGAYATAATSWFRQDYGGFGFNTVPSTNTVTGIEVKLELSGTTAAGTVSVALSWDGGTSTTSIKTSPTLTTSDAVITLGSVSDTWGHTWTPAQLANANFKVRVVAEPSSNTVKVDAIQVKVTHIATGGSQGGGGEAINSTKARPMYANLASIYNAGHNFLLAGTFLAKYTEGSLMYLVALMKEKVGNFLFVFF